MEGYLRFYFGSTTKKKKKKVGKPLRRGPKTGGGSDILQGTQWGQRSLMSQALHSLVHSSGLGVSTQFSEEPKPQATLLPHSHGASDVLTFQVQEAMFLEEPPATVGLRSPVIPLEKNKGQEGCASVCICLQPYASSTPHIFVCAHTRFTHRLICTHL